MSYGHALKTAGRQRRCDRRLSPRLELDADLGEAWWSLANLKTFRFTRRRLAAMRAQLARD